MKWDYVKDCRASPQSIAILAPSGAIHAYLTAVQGDWNGFKLEECAKAIVALLNKQNALNSKEIAFPVKLEDDITLKNSVITEIGRLEKCFPRARFEYGFLRGVQWMLDQIHANKEGASSTSQEKLAVEITRAIDSYLDSLIAREPRSDKILEIVRDTIGKHTPISP